MTYRECIFQVGSFYKIPQFPIWVVGSTSHFTVLFSMDRYLPSVYLWVCLTAYASFGDLYDGVNCVMFLSVSDRVISLPKCRQRDNRSLCVLP